MNDQTKALVNRLARYFRDYGGWEALVGSPLFILSAILVSINYNYWLNDGQWVTLCQAMVPSLLGFSLGTYAILFSLITNRMRRALKAVKNDRGVSYLDEINATFFHFIFVQSLALAWSFIYQSTILYDIMNVMSKIVINLMWLFTALHFLGAAFGFFLLIYSFVLVIGAALAVYRLASITDPKAD